MICVCVCLTSVLFSLLVYSTVCVCALIIYDLMPHLLYFVFAHNTSLSHCICVCVCKLSIMQTDCITTRATRLAIISIFIVYRSCVCVFAIVLILINQHIVVGLDLLCVCCIFYTLLCLLLHMVSSCVCQLRIHYYLVSYQHTLLLILYAILTCCLKFAYFVTLCCCCLQNCDTHTRLFTFSDIQFH
jgi:hypothetical protein